MQILFNSIFLEVNFKNILIKLQFILIHKTMKFDSVLRCYY